MDNKSNIQTVTSKSERSEIVQFKSFFGFYSAKNGCGVILRKNIHHEFKRLKEMDFVFVKKEKGLWYFEKRK